MERLNIASERFALKPSQKLFMIFLAIKEEGVMNGQALLKPGSRAFHGRGMVAVYSGMQS